MGYNHINQTVSPDDLFDLEYKRFNRCNVFFKFGVLVIGLSPAEGATIPTSVNISRAGEAERAIKLYGSMLYTLALSRCNSKEDAEDVYQEVLFALLNKKRPFKNDEHMKAWLIRATIHRSKNIHRYRSRHPHTTYDPALHDRATHDENPANEKLHEAIETLTPELKETLRLYYRDSYSSKEIAMKKGIEESSVRARLHRARTKIAAALACMATICVVLFASASLPMQQIPEAQAIDFATANNTSLANLPVKAIQKTGNAQALVTFEANLTWSVSGAERVVYSTNAENAKLYSPGIGNYYTINDGKLGSTKDAIQVSNGEASIALNIEMPVEINNNASDDELCDTARKALEGKALIATAYFKDGTSETAECFFVE